MPRDLQDQKEIPTCSTKIPALRLLGIPGAAREGTPTLPRGPAPRRAVPEGTVRRGGAVHPTYLGGLEGAGNPLSPAVLGGRATQLLTWPGPTPETQEKGLPGGCSPAGMREGFSASAPEQGLQGCRARASNSSCGFTGQPPIFGPSKARACSGTPPPGGGELLARARRVPVPPGRPLRRLRPERASQARAAGQQPGRSFAEAPRRGGQLIASPGAAMGGPRPGYWPARPGGRLPAPRRDGAPRRPREGPSAATCGGARRPAGTGRALRVGVGLRREEPPPGLGRPGSRRSAFFPSARG